MSLIILRRCESEKINLNTDKFYGSNSYQYTKANIE